MLSILIFQFLNLKYLSNIFLDHHFFIFRFTYIIIRTCCYQACSNWNSPEEYIERWPCRKIPNCESQDEVPMVWNYLAWSACHKNDCPPPPAARDTCNALLGKNRSWCKKLHCMNIADQVVAFTRFKYMLKHAQLMGVSLGNQQGKIEGKIIFSSFGL